MSKFWFLVIVAAALAAKLWIGWTLLAQAFAAQE